MKHTACSLSSITPHSKRQNIDFFFDIDAFHNLLEFMRVNHGTPMPRKKRKQIDMHAKIID